MINIALFGLPACGKGTQAKLLQQAFGLEQLSTGDLIRQLRVSDGGPVGEALRALPVGAFASDELIVQAVAQALREPQYQKGVILDGFPRTLAQAQVLSTVGVQLNAAIYFQADEEALIERAINRRVHLPSGRVYNLKSAPPKTSGQDDVTGEPLTHREDDHEEIVRRRFLDFHTKTVPAIEFLKEKAVQDCKVPGAMRYIEVNAMQTADVVFSQVQTSLLALQASIVPPSLSTVASPTFARSTVSASAKEAAGTPPKRRC